MSLPTEYYRLLNVRFPNIIDAAIEKGISVWVCNKDTCEEAILANFKPDAYEFTNGTTNTYDTLLNNSTKNAGFYIHKDNLKNIKIVAKNFGGGDNIQLHGVEGGRRKSKRTARKRLFHKRHTYRQRSRR